MQIKIHSTENLLFVLKVLFSVFILGVLFTIIGNIFPLRDETTAYIFIIYIVYAFLIWLFVIFQKVYFVAYLKGNGIEITDQQFPDIYSSYIQMINELGIIKAPKLFIVQHGGLLNAFAIRLSGKTYIAIYSDIFSLIHSDIDSVKFVLGHELGHVKRNHMAKRFWTFPSSIVPFLTPAYARACEYTCDNIGNLLAPKGSLNGLLVLAAGKELYKQINIENYIKAHKGNNSLSVKLIGLVISHPYLPRRLQNLNLDEELT